MLEPAEQSNGKRPVELIKAVNKIQVGLSESVLLTDISDSILESEKEPGVFELLFKIYYS